MIHTHSLGRAARYYPERTALASGGTRSTFRELHDRVARIAAVLSRHGFGAGDRLAILLPNEPEYIELVYACSWLGVIAVPLNTRLSVIEIDRILADASPRGLIRHSSLPVPTVQLSWQLVLDEEPLDVRSDASPDAMYDPEAILALIYTSGTTGRPKGVVVTHADILANVHHLNDWMPYRESGVYFHAAPMFHILDLPFMFAAPACRESTVCAGNARARSGAGHRSPLAAAHGDGSGSAKRESRGVKRVEHGRGAGLARSLGYRLVVARLPSRPVPDSEGYQ